MVPPENSGDFEFFGDRLDTGLGMSADFSQSPVQDRVRGHRRAAGKRLRYRADCYFNVNMKITSNIHVVCILHIHICICAYMCIYIYIYICVCVIIYTYIYIYI